MSDAALFEEDALEADGMHDAFEELDADESLDFDASEELDGLDEDGFAEEALDFADEGDEAYDGLESDEFSADEEDDLDGFAFDEATGLYAPSASLVSGPAALAMMRSLNPFVLSSMDSDDADAFFGNLFRGIRNVVSRVGRGIGGVVRKVGGGLARFGRMAAPFLKKALPFVQNIVRNIPGFGTIASAALGGLQGLMDGKGLGGALQGALGGVLPGPLAGIAKTLGGGGGLGNLLKGVLGGDGADDDADLDALADMADAHRVPHAVAHPIAAGLGARLLMRRMLDGMTGHPLAHVLRRMHHLHPTMKNVERALVRAAHRIGGAPGRGVRAIRHVARQAAAVAAPRTTSLPAIVRTAPAATKVAIGRVIRRAAQSPRAYARPVAVAARRHRMRRHFMRRLPIDLVFRGYATSARSYA